MPSEIWPLTLYEAQLSLEGFAKRQDIENRRTAWLIVNMLQPFSKSRLSVAKLLGDVVSFDDISEDRRKELLDRIDTSKTEPTVGGAK